MDHSLEELLVAGVAATATAELIARRAAW